MPTIPRPALRRVSPRRLTVVAGIWAVLTLAAILIALALDSPVGAGERDEAQPVAQGPVARGPEGGAAPAPGAAQANLPPLTLVIDRGTPAEVAGMSVSSHDSPYGAPARGNAFPSDSSARPPHTFS